MSKRYSTSAQMAMLSGAKFWNQAVSLIKTMIIVRMFSLSEYSTYTKMLLILDFAFAIIVLNLPSCANYFVANAVDEDDKKNFIFTYYCLCTFVGIGMGVLLVSLAPQLGIFLNNSSIDTYKWFLGLTCLPQIITLATNYILTSQGKSSDAVKITFASSIMTLIGLFAAYISSDSFTICLSVMLLIEWFMTFISYWIGIKNIGGIREGLGRRNGLFSKVRFKSVYIKKIYAYIIPIGLSSLVLIINTRVDKILVSLNYSNDYYAIYANASKELPVAAISVVVASVLIPKLVKFVKENDYRQAISIWNHALVLVSSFSFLLLVGTFVFAPEVMTIIYSNKYLAGVHIFRIYLLLIPFHCIEYTFLLSAIGKTKYILVSSIVSMVVNVGLDFLLLHMIGVIGLGLATLVATIVMVIVQLFFTARLLNVKILSLIPIDKLALLLTLNVSMGIVFNIVNDAINIDLMLSEVGEAIILGILWAGIYFLLIYKFIKKEWNGLNFGD